MNDNIHSLIFGDFLKLENARKNGQKRGTFFRLVFMKEHCTKKIHNKNSFLILIQQLIADNELLLLKTDISLKNKYIYDVLEIR